MRENNITYITLVKRLPFFEVNCMISKLNNSYIIPGIHILIYYRVTLGRQSVIVISDKTNRMLNYLSKFDLQ